MGRARKVSGLISACMNSGRPSFSTEKPRKAKGTIAQGHSYEKHFGQLLQKGAQKSGHILQLNPWIRFEDKNGWGWAQPDALLFSKKALYIFECKRTESTTGWVQLYSLYSPLLEHLYPEWPQVRVQVCKNLRLNGTMPGAPIVTSLKEISDGCILNWRNL